MYLWIFIVSNGLKDEERTILYNNLNDRKKYIDSKKS